MRRLLSLLLASLIGSAVAFGVRYFFPPAPVVATASDPTPQAQRGEDLPPPPPGPAGPALPPPHPTGYAFKGGVVLVQMSDGTRRWHDRNFPTVSDGIEAVTPSSVVLLEEGKIFIKPVPKLTGGVTVMPSPVQPVSPMIDPAASMPPMSAPAPAAEQKRPDHTFKNTYSIHRWH